MENDKFDYTYAALTEEERLEIEQMRREYSPEQNKLSALEKMRRLNRKVRRPAEITAVVMGVVGVLTFGAGLSIVMDAVHGGMTLGGILGVAGVAMIFAIRPVYKLIIKKRKEKYGKEILGIAERLLNEDVLPKREE